MALTRRRVTRECNGPVVREVEAGTTLAQAAREDQVHPSLIVRWRQEHLQSAERAFMGNGRMDTDEARVAEFARMIGQLTREHALFTKAWLRLAAPGRERSGPGER